MYEGNPADLRMEKMLAVDGIFDDCTHSCKVLKYDNGEDDIWFLLGEGELASLCLDAKYSCRICTKSELLSCSGTVKERYRCSLGNIVVFKIEDGFYSASGKKNSYQGMG